MHRVAGAAPRAHRGAGGIGILTGNVGVGLRAGGYRIASARARDANGACPMTERSLTLRRERPLMIRRADLPDAEQLAVLGLQVWLDNYATQGIHPAIARYVLETFTPNSFRALLANPDRLVFIAERGRNAIGMSIVALDRRTRLSDASRQAEIDRLYIQEPFCNAGIGARMIAAIEEELSDRNFDAMWLEVWVENERALKFYDRVGFGDVGTGWFELNGRKHENRVLVKRLG
jgi:ribosomal protein S18 acetylase RimI-like enzyme